MNSSSSTAFEKAPWSPGLRLVSWLLTLLSLGGVVMLLICPASLSAATRGLALVAVLALLGGCALFTVRGYRLVGQVLEVQRLGWVTSIDLHQLTSAEFRQGRFGWAWRLFGNGGLYGFSGWFYQKPLGHFRVLATRTEDLVILRFSNRHPLVISPEQPAAFTKALQDHLPLRDRTCGDVLP